jgi:N-acetylneuraminate synthase
VIARNRQSLLADGMGFKSPQPSELSDREWRADPADGMRPLKHVRLAYKGEPA